MANPGAASASVTLELVRGDGTLAATATRSVAANGAVAEGVAQLFPGVATFDGGMYIRGTATRGVVPFEYLGKAGQYVEGLNGQDPALGARMIYSPQYVVGGAWRTTVSVVNFENRATTLSLRLIDNNGVVIGSRTQALAAGGKFQLAAQNFFLTPNPQLLTEGYLEITSDAANLGGSVVFGDAARSAYSAALPLLGKPQTSAIFSQVAKNSTYYTGLAVLNPSEASATFVLDVLDKAGTTVATRSVTLQGKRRTSRLLTDHFPALPDMTTGYFRITSDQGLLSFALFGTSSALSAIPPQAVP